MVNEKFVGFFMFISSLVCYLSWCPMVQVWIGDEKHHFWVLDIMGLYLY